MLVRSQKCRIWRWNFDENLVTWPLSAIDRQLPTKCDSSVRSVWNSTRIDLLVDTITRAAVLSNWPWFVRIGPCEGQGTFDCTRAKSSLDSDVNLARLRRHRASTALCHFPTRCDLSIRDKQSWVCSSIPEEKHERQKKNKLRQENFQGGGKGRKKIKWKVLFPVLT